MRICFFRDHDLWHKRDTAGRNKIGYITRYNRVVYAFRTGVKVAPLAKIAKKKLTTMVTVPLSSELEDKIETFFTENVLNNLLFQQGIKALTALLSKDNRFMENPDIFFQNPIYLPNLKPVDTDRYEAQWRKCLLLLKPGDMVYVLDEDSLLSRLIAKVDKGTWSHVACYVGNGNISEAITTGVVERSIDCYKGFQYRLGIYRARNLSQEQLDKLLAFNRSCIGMKYGWSKAIRLGLKKLFGIPVRRYESHNISPNDLVALVQVQMPLIFVL
jgi:hypothetical protein